MYTESTRKWMERIYLLGNRREISRERTPGKRTQGERKDR
jgi:hypothetical protein